MPPAPTQWFIRYIETFAPAVLRQERHAWYQSLHALPVPLPTSRLDDVGLFVLAQVVAAQQLAKPPAAAKASGQRRAQATWYAKERQRVAKLLAQIAESPVVAAFQADVQYYQAEDVTCQHGRNIKTCEALYALALTLQFLEHYPGHGIVRKQVERLRQREPYLPPLPDLCTPQMPGEEDPAAAPPMPTPLPDDVLTYLLGTIVSRLRHAGLTVAQSCAIVDRALHYCFDQPDPDGTRPAYLAEQWQRLG